MSKASILAVDVGYGNTKAVWSNPAGPDFGPSDQICFSSVAPPCHVPALEKLDGLGSRDRIVVEIDGHHFFVGPEATMGDGARMLDPDFILRAEYRALLAGAIYYYVKSTGNLSQSLDVLALGLPVSSFAARRHALKALGARVHQVPLPRALAEHAGRDTLEVVARKVLVVPQPYGGLRYALSPAFSADQALFDDDGIVNVVIDPGFNTFDWFVAKGMDPQFELGGSFAGGVSQIIREVAHTAGLRLGIGDLNFVAAERALHSGVLHHGGHRIDFSSYRVVAQAAAQRVVDEFLAAFNFERVGVGRVILAGGGAAHYLEPLRRRLPGFDIQVTSDSVMANAKGYWLLANGLVQARSA
jgi:plasmid segregation protein ParM